MLHLQVVVGYSRDSEALCLALQPQHHDISKYHQSNCKVHAKVLHNLESALHRSAWRLCKLESRILQYQMSSTDHVQHMWRVPCSTVSYRTGPMHEQIVSQRTTKTVNV